MKHIIIVVMFLILALNIGCDPTRVTRRVMETGANIDSNCIMQTVKRTKGVIEVEPIDSINSEKYYGNPIIYFRTDICDGWIRIENKNENENLIEIYRTQIGAIKPIAKYSKPVEEQFELIGKNIISFCGGAVKLK